MTLRIYVSHSLIATDVSTGGFLWNAIFKHMVLWQNN